MAGEGQFHAPGTVRGEPGENQRAEKRAAYAARNGKSVDTRTKGAILSASEETALEKYISSDAYKINALLREGADLNGYSEMSAALDGALKKMPAYSGTLVRDLVFDDFSDRESITQEFVDQFVVGKEIRFPEYLSTTSNNAYSKNPTVMIFIMDAEKGRDIRRYNPEESEVLYERNSEFRVLEKTYADGVYKILLEEAR